MRELHGAPPISFPSRVWVPPSPRLPSPALPWAPSWPYTSRHCTSRRVAARQSWAHVLTRGGTSRGQSAAADVRVPEAPVCVCAHFTVQFFSVVVYTWLLALFAFFDLSQVAAGCGGRHCVSCFCKCCTRHAGICKKRRKICRSPCLVCASVR